MTNQEIIEDVRRLQRGVSPKNDISNILIYHNCDYLLSITPKSSCTQRLVLDNVINHVAIKERFKVCASLFERIKVPYAIIKGAVLSCAIYQNPFLRTSGDIDILIRRQDIEYIKVLLRELGFVQGRVTKEGIKPFSREELIFHSTMSHQMAPFIKETQNNLCPYVNLDVNLDILWGEISEKADMNYVLSHVEKCELFDTTFNKLSPEMEFVALCLHHYKDLNSLYLLSLGSFRLGLYCDIYDYICNVRMDLLILREVCENLNVGKYIFVCVYQVAELFDDSCVKPYLDLLCDYEDTILCNSFGLNETERKCWDMPLLDRVFYHNIPEYIESKFSAKEREKVAVNKKFM